MKRLNIDNGFGLISIHSDDIIEYLKVKTPTAIKWYTNSGTVDEYFVNLPNEYKISDTYINSLNKDYTDNEEQLIKDINPLLNLLENSTYEIQFHSGVVPSFFKLFTDRKGEPYWLLDICNQHTLIDCANKIKQEAKSNGFKESDLLDTTTDTIYEPIIIGSQPMSMMNMKRIDYYKDIIKQGFRPFAIILNCSSSMFGYKSNSYIIDGHHKLLAYKALNIFPHLVEITKLGKTNKSIDSEFLLNNLYPWQMEHMIKNCNSIDTLFKESITNIDSKIHKYL